MHRDRLKKPLCVVDFGMIHPEGAGISRYLYELLPRMVLQGRGGRFRWRGYGRGAWQLAAMPIPADKRRRIHLRSDWLPYALGRLSSLFFQAPIWSRLDRPALYWGPAHRLPVSLPQATRCVLTIHDLSWRSAPDTMRSITRLFDRGFMGRSIQRADAVVAVSRSIADEVRELYPCDAEKVVAVPSAASLTPSTSTDLADIEPRLSSGRFLLFVGTFEPRKNLRRLLSAHVQCFATHRIPLVLVGGEGWRDASIHSAIREAEGEGRVIRVGRVSDSRLAALYAHAICLVFPSLYEGFGLPLLEAMSTGTPVITSNHGACAEVAADGGLLVDPTSVEEIAAAMNVMVSDQALRDRLAQRAAVVANRYDWDQTATTMLDVFERLLE